MNNIATIVQRSKGFPILIERVDPPSSELEERVASLEQQIRSFEVITEDIQSRLTGLVISLSTITDITDELTADITKQRDSIGSLTNAIESHVSDIININQTLDYVQQKRLEAASILSELASTFKD